jgi:DNA polymerase I-like protein with 3'-5' exonuclease and polymerase domains
MGLILTKEELNEMVEHYLKQDAFAFDVETMGEHRGLTVVNDVVWISFATYGRVDVIPMGHPNGEFVELVRPLTGQGEKRVAAGLEARPLDYSKDDKKAKKVFTEPPAQLFPAEVFKALKPLLFNTTITKIGHNLVFDLCSITKYCGGNTAPGPYFDTMIASFLYDTRNKGKCGLADCLKRELGFEMVKGVGKEIEAHSFSDTYKYAALDAKYTFLLWDVLKPKLTSAGVERTMALEMDVLKVLCDMKLTGAPIDTFALKQLKDRLESEIDLKRAFIYKEAGRQFNINSVQEKQELLFKPKSQGGRGLKTSILTTNGKSKEREELSYSDYSTSAEALVQLAGKDPLVNLLNEYADLNKLMTTYIMPYLGGDITKTVNGETKIEHKTSLLIKGRIHCDFVQNGAETGRFSSKNPNLQNLPNPQVSANAKAIRNLFIAPEGYKLVVADYSQIEPRIIASLSKDPIMLKNYEDDEDLYTTIGRTMDVDRKAGKVLVLAISYGVGPDKIARQVGCKISEARDLIDNFAKEFSSIPKYKARVVALARAKGYVTTMTGRRRYLTGIKSNDRELRGSAERQAFNTVIQGTAADIMKIAMVRAHALVPKESKLLLTVHDELVTLAPNHLVEETVNAVREAMEGVKMITIPLIADIKVVDRWGDAK